MIPYSRQHISQKDIDSVVEVLRSNFLTQGPLVPRFEEAVANFVGAHFAVASNSATSSLHIACLALGVSRGDIVWTVPNTFVASANCALYCGAQIDFVDIDPRTFNLSVSALEKKLHEAKQSGKLPKVLIPVHFAGQSCEMERIYNLCNPLGIRIIEDASHAIGGTYKELPVGSCQFSDITIFSFHPVKIITSGEGGMAVTNDNSLAESMRLFRCHGITKDENSFTRAPHGGWYFEQIELGYNYRMTDILAALGLSQMEKLAEFVGKRQEIAMQYTEALKGLPVVLPEQHHDSNSSYHLYVIRVPSVEGRSLRNRLYEAMHKNGVGVNVHYIPVHLHPFYQRIGFKKGQFPVCEDYYDEALTLPIFPELNSDQFKVIVENVRQVLDLN